MVNISKIMLNALGQQGDRYVFGAETTPQQENPTKFDCSELVQWSCEHSGLHMVDGAANQFHYCQSNHTVIPIERAMHTWGALMFPYPNVHHVVFSLGDGLRTIEAKGAKWGVGIFSSVNRFQRGALIPGVDYTPAPMLPAPTPPGAQIVDDLTFIDGSGGWKLGRDGGIFTWGRAPFYGSYPGLAPQKRQGDRYFTHIEGRGGPAGYAIYSNHNERYDFGPDIAYP